jgi:23S rRNA (uracil1939-C5)-methyltransferase
MNPVVTITALDQDGRGIARVDGKATFVEGALVGEHAEIEVTRRKSNYDQARVIRIVRSSPERVTPRCPHFGVCGGCSLQHVEASAQVAIKQRILEDALWHIGRVRAQTLLPPVHGPAWAYRQRGRLSVRHVPRKGGVLVGFHEKHSSYVADMLTCPVLPVAIGTLLPELRTLIGAMTLRDRIPQIELACGEGSAGAIYALVLRVLDPLPPEDAARLRSFAAQHHVSFWLQPGGPDTVQPLDGDAELSYALPEFDLRFGFAPTDFTQVNAGINRMLVRRAMALLDPQPDERIGDFFCGLGNFTLPIARRGAHAIGIEGNAAMVRRARANAVRNDLDQRASFFVANLFEATVETLAALGPLDKALVDPPREGAIAWAKALPADGLSRVVYVSCNPATLARDAAVLVSQHGYALRAAGVANMFPHTAHVESMALFEREASCG